MVVASRPQEAGEWLIDQEVSTMNGIRTILHPTDFSENASFAFQTACAIAREKQAKLILLHVMMPSPAPLLQVPPSDPRHSAESQRKRYSTWQVSPPVTSS